MTSVPQVIKSIGPKLVPFFKTVTVYFVVFIPDNSPSFLSTILKCLPIISLILFVYLHRVSLGPEYKYSRKILIGLIFSCLGDASLIWPHLFELGMVFFTIAHCFYISAFTFKPLRLPLGIILYSVMIMGIKYVWEGLDGILLVGVPVYSFILTTMTWRSAARVELSRDKWSWAKFCAALGGINFAVSDFLIGVDKFKQDVPFAQIIIMATYYAAQFSISLSVDDEKIIERPNSGRQQKMRSKTSTKN